MTADVADARHRTPLLGFVLLGQLAVICSLGVVNLALPAIERDLDATASELQWIIVIQPLAYAVLLIVGGRLGDVYGYRRVLIAGLLTFTAASLAAAIAPTASIVVLARLAQGAAGGFTSPQVLAIIQTVVPPAGRARAYAAFSTVGGAGFMIGQLGAGLLMDHGPFGWRLPFLMVALCSSIAAVGVTAMYRTPHRGDRRSIDAPGCLLGGAATVALLFPLVQGRAAGWPWYYGAIAAGGVALAFAFGRRQQRLTSQDRSLIDTTLFRLAEFRTGLALMALFAFSAFAPFFVVAYTLQRGFGLDPTRTALVTIGGPVAMIVGTTWAPGVTARLGRSVFPIGAALTASSSIAVLAVLRGAASEADLFWLVPAFGLQGLGQGLFLPGLTSLTMHPVPRARASAASSVYQTVQQFASAMGLACYGVVFFGALGDGVEPADYADAFARLVPIVVVTAVALGATSRLLSPRSMRPSSNPLDDGGPVLTHDPTDR